MAERLIQLAHTAAEQAYLAESDDSKAFAVALDTAVAVVLEGVLESAMHGDIREDGESVLDGLRRDTFSVKDSLVTEGIMAALTVVEARA